MMVDLEKVNECPECGSTNIVHVEDKDEIVCKDCGAIFAELDPEDEKKFEDASEVI